MGLMQRRQDPPVSQRDDLDAPGAAVEVHGHAVTASSRAAAFYRQAQRAIDRRQATIALRLAVEADPAFELALSDLDATTGTSGQRHSRGQMNWERHHIEVLRTAASGNLERATDLLRDHLDSVGCDPLLLHIVADLRRAFGEDDNLEDCARRLSGCHPVAWQCPL